jgi:isoleucyl-tRNA synthetase
VVESYRRIRNTLCFLLGNLSDFNAATDALPATELLEIDRYMLALTQELSREVLDDYDSYAFHPATARLLAFCSEDLGAFYLDILKDRLYTSARDSHARRAAQTVLWHITESMTRLLAPFLSFTANEAWQALRLETGAATKDGETIFELTAHELPAVANAPELIAKWSRVRAARADVLKAIEVEREAGRIGASLQADVAITAGSAMAQALQTLGDGLKFVMITSQASLTEDSSLDPDAVHVRVRAITDPKCSRCWHLRPDVGANAEHPLLCGRCISNLFGAGDSRAIA